MREKSRSGLPFRNPVNKGIGTAGRSSYNETSLGTQNFLGIRLPLVVKKELPEEIPWRY